MAAILRSILPGMRLMVRNAELQRQLQRGEEPNPHAWESGPEGRAITRLTEEVEDLERRLQLLSKAARFDPAARLSQD